jgi:arylsulfatase
MAFNTPFKLWKRYSWNGGICDPMMVHWPKGIKAKGEVRDQYTHCSDVVPTIYDCLGIELPAEVKGYTQWPLEGASFKYSFDDAKAATQKDTQYYVMLGTRGVWHKGWKADTIHPSAPGDWSHFTEDVWELYNTEVDRSECKNLADQEPVKLRELQDLWFVEAGKYFGLPLEDRGAIAVLTTPRPQMSPPRSRYIYYPNTLEVPEAVAVNVRGRSYKIAAEVTIETSEAEGVLFAHGHKFGGHALYVKDGKLKYVYNFLGETEQMVTSDVNVPQGKCVLGVEFAKEKLNAIRNSPFPNQCIGTATLYINDKKVGELKGMATQLGKFALCGEGLNIGRDGSANVTNDYPGDMPWAFTGGAIEQVIVDVSDEPYSNLELEAMAVLSRE